MDDTDTHRYGQIRVFDTDTSTPFVGVPATYIIRQGRSLRERSLYAMGGTYRPSATNKLAHSVSFMTGQLAER